MEVKNFNCSDYDCRTCPYNVKQLGKCAITELKDGTVFTNNTKMYRVNFGFAQSNWYSSIDELMEDFVNHNPMYKPEVVREKYIEVKEW